MEKQKFTAEMGIEIQQTQLQELAIILKPDLHEKLSKLCELINADINEAIETHLGWVNVENKKDNIGQIVYRGTDLHNTIFNYKNGNEMKYFCPILKKSYTIK